MAIISTNNRKNHAKLGIMTVKTGAAVLDYPMQGEKIDSKDYTVRVGAPSGVKKVEVAIDQGSWRACRPAVGYWWYDWSGFEPGEHEVVARAQTEDGRTLRTEIHDCVVSGQLKAGLR